MTRSEPGAVPFEMRTHLAAIVDSSDDAILSKDLEGRIISWNKGAERLYGYTAEDMLGRRISVLVPDDRPDEEPDILARVRGGEVVDHFETRRIRKDGTEVPVSLTISPVRTADGQIAGASSIARDITERKQLEAALEEARDRAMEISRLKSDFLATMSHEIRTPMNGVIGMIGLLLDTELDREQREYAETVRRSGEALLAIINDILDFSKVEAGKLDLELIDFDLRAVLEEVADLLAEQAHAKGLELVTLVRPDVPTLVQGDPGRLRQILTNLMSNAIKFTESGEVVVRAIEEEATAEDVVVRFDVVDTGIGIPPQARPALFRPFSQADSSTTRLHGGTGLGLAISQQLIELMGGTIEVESEVGRGSTFSFTIRLDKRIGGPPAPPPRTDLDDLRVLIVDDNATNRTILAQQVASWGMHATLAEGGAAALQELRDGARRGERYDVALLDMDMPGMDGIQLAEAIRDEAALADLPLLLLTSSALRGAAAAARKAGFSAFLTKPVRQSQLFDAVAMVMGASTADQGTFVTRHTLSEGRALVRPRVLVAEDNTVNQMVAVAVLTKLGYRADVASNGLEALEVLSQAAYGAVLMDCQMPEMDGYAATAEIRRREQVGQRLPVIAVTAGAMAGDQERCLAAGMDDYISKPIMVEDLAAVLHRWIPLASTHPPGGERAIGPAAEPILDPAQIASLRALSDAPGSGEQLAILVTTFLDGARTCVADVRANSSDGETIRQLAHKLAGSSGSLGAQVVQRVARELEAVALTDPDAVGDVVDRLDAAVREVAPVLRAAFAPPEEAPSP